MGSTNDGACRDRRPLAPAAKRSGLGGQVAGADRHSRRRRQPGRRLSCLHQSARRARRISRARCRRPAIGLSRGRPVRHAVGLCSGAQLSAPIFGRWHADAIFFVGPAGLALVVTVPRAELLAPFAFGAIVLACALESQVAAALFANRTSSFRGEISFSSYLSHAIIISGGGLLASSLGLGDGSLFLRTMFLIVCGSVILGVSYLSWRSIERPGRAAGRAYWRRLDRRVGAGQATG